MTVTCWSERREQRWGIRDASDGFKYNELELAQYILKEMGYVCLNRYH